MRACVCVYVCGCLCVCVSVCVCVCVCEGGARVMLVRYLCVLRVSFWCLELCVFLFNCCTRLGLILDRALKDLIIIINK